MILPKFIYPPHLFSSSYPAISSYLPTPWTVNDAVYLQSSLHLCTFTRNRAHIHLKHYFSVPIPHGLQMLNPAVALHDIPVTFLKLLQQSGFIIRTAPPPKLPIPLPRSLSIVRLKFHRPFEHATD